MKQWLKGLTSRKFILAIVAAAVAFVNFMYDLGLTVEQVLTVISPLLAFIGMEGVGDAAARLKQAEPPTLPPVSDPELEALLAGPDATVQDQTIIPGNDY